MMGFNELLIKFVKEQPCLYDTTSQAFKDKRKKEIAWEEISLKTTQPVSVCMKRWTSLRDKFAKEKKRIDAQTRNGSSPFASSTWEHFDSMLFLKDHIKHRMTASYFRENSFHYDPFSRIDVLVEDDNDDTTMGESESSGNLVLESPVCKPIEISEIESLNKMHRKRKQEYRQEKFQSHHSINDASFDLLSPPPPTLQPFNQYQAFGLMVTARLQSVPPETAETMMASISSCLFKSE